MIEELALYVITSLVFSIGFAILWPLKSLSTAKTIFLLFCLDMALTIEAAFYGDIVLIAVLHVFSIPAFFGLIYLDLVKQHQQDFRCFVCGKLVQESEEITVVKRISEGKQKNVTVHSACIDLDNRNRKAFSKRSFRDGIPR